MVDDVNPELRAELEAAKEVLEPQIRGLHDLFVVSISVDLKQEVAAQIEVRERRRGKIQTVLRDLDKIAEDLDTLGRDGYPTIEDSQLPDHLFSELTGENQDLDAALKIFKLDGAENISLLLGEPFPKPPRRKSDG